MTEDQSIEHASIAILKPGKFSIALPNAKIISPRYRAAM